MATKTIGDYWRECNNEELASNLLDFITSMLIQAGVDEDEIDLISEYEILVNFFDTEYEEADEEHLNPSTGGFSYIN